MASISKKKSGIQDGVDAAQVSKNYPPELQ